MKRVEDSVKEETTEFLGKKYEIANLEEQGELPLARGIEGLGSHP